MGYPDEYLCDMQALLGKGFGAFRAALQEGGHAALRLNPLRSGAEALLHGICTDVVPWEPRGRYVREGFRPGADPLYLAGGYYMQEASAMAPARVLDPRPGDRVLDLCAAPGGKSGQLAAALEGKGFLVANEPDSRRARALAGNLERLGVANAAVLNQLPERLARAFPDAFDAVLVDAPCSGEGMFRRDPETRAQWSKANVLGCARRQKAILLEAARMVRPGGRLVYSTCTFNALENEENVEALLRARPDFAPAPFSLPGVGDARDGCLRLWPHEIRGEGHFVALLRRSGGAPAPVFPRLSPDGEARHAWGQLLSMVPGDWPRPFGGWTPRFAGDTLWLLPPGMPEFKGLLCLGAGLRLAARSGRILRPHHALAMAADPARVRDRMELDPAQCALYLRGGTLPTPCRGWTLATRHGLALGWGKGAEGILKNHLPKGLRIGSGNAL
jgi:NOL1/NOP2/sun family putative RNA methylase